MKHLWTLFFVLCCVTMGHGRMKCLDSDDNCLCLPGPEFEYQCPPNYKNMGGFVMHVNEFEKYVLIDCFTPYPETFNIDQLPNITIGEVYKFNIRFCPLPQTGFKDILDKLSVTSVQHLQFGSSEVDNITLTGSYFEGLDMLKVLTIGKNKYVDLDEDVFINTPNLTDVELSGNNLYLKPNIFRHTPLLKSLDISQNHLESLPKDLFLDMKHLERLYLWQNNLTSIDEFTFDGLSNLKSLELSVNNIDNISENAFKNLTKLSQVSLGKNNLGLIPSNLFQGNIMLKLIIMRSNFHLKLPDYLFSNLPILETVELTNCKLESVPEHIFENSTNLKSVILKGNRLKTVPRILFQELKNLEELYLENNKIEDISNVFTSLKKLKKLNLQNNLISVLEEDAFKALFNLERINLQRNRIYQIHYRTFADQINLVEINLSHNEISGHLDNPILGSLLENNIKLENVDVSFNHITDVEDVINLYNKVNIKTLNLSHNRITSISLRSLQTVTSKKELVVRLDNNNITRVDFYSDLGDKENLDAISYNNYPYSVLHLNNNPIECNCQNYDLLSYFRSEISPEIQYKFDIKQENLTCAGPYNLEDSSFETLSPERLVCPLEDLITNYTDCPESCSCNWRPFDQAIIINCSDNNLYTFPEILLPSASEIKFNHTEMHLEKNKLSIGPDRNLSYYDNITKLFLSHNKISEISWLPPELEVLTLDNNQLNSLDYEVLNALNTTDFSSLTLNGNPWLCECGIQNLTNFLRQHVKQVDASYVNCFNSSVRLIDLNRSDLCQEFQMVYIMLPVMVMLLISAVLVALYYRYQKELKIWLFAKNLCLWWVTEEDLDKDKVYDAFISYSHKDEDFVIQNLLPRLENGPHPYKLCLHYRNWIPGEFIAKQVTNSVIESRRTLVVLSPNFLESVWGKLEFRTAHTQAMTEGRARVVIVLYGDVDVNSLDSELKAYLKTNTYVKWGEPYFWNKLIYALPHSKRNISNINQKHANVMNCIDDKFKLVAPITASPGSTPPVLSLDPCLLKHPLNFVPSPEMDTPPAESGTLLTSTCL